MNRHYPIQGQLASVLYDDVRNSLDSVARTVFLPNKHGWEKAAAEVLGALPRSVFAQIGWDIASYRHVVVRPDASAPSETHYQSAGTFAINVVLQGEVEVRWRELGQGHARYGARDVFIMDASAPHAVHAMGGEVVMGSFAPASGMTYENAMLLIRSWIRGRQG